jgi:hypothetical protein
MPIILFFKRYVLVLLATCLMQTPLAHSALIGFQPDTAFADTGDSISLNLVISDLGNFAPDSLGAFDISIGFDASALSFTGYSFGDYLGDLDLFEAIDASAGDLGGAVNVAEVSLLPAALLDALQPDTFILATLNFSVIDLAAGADTLLSVLSAQLADASGFEIENPGLGSALIQSTVPVPGTLLLMAASLFGWLTLKRRQSV